MKNKHFIKSKGMHLETHYCFLFKLQITKYLSTFIMLNNYILFTQSEQDTAWTQWWSLARLPHPPTIMQKDIVIQC